MSIQFQEDVNSVRLAQRNHPCLRLILQWANAEKHPDQNLLKDLKIKKANAIAQEDAVAMWGLWDQMDLTDGVLYRKWYVEGSNTTQKQLVVPQFWNNFTIQNSVEAILLFKRPWTGQDRGFGGQM